VVAAEVDHQSGDLDAVGCECSGAERQQIIYGDPRLICVGRVEDRDLFLRELGRLLEFGISRSDTEAKARAKTSSPDRVGDEI
jgi:hypothetical protein